VASAGGRAGPEDRRAAAKPLPRPPTHGRLGLVKVVRLGRHRLQPRRRLVAGRVQLHKAAVQRRRVRVAVCGGEARDDARGVGRRHVTSAASPPPRTLERLDERGQVLLDRLVGVCAGRSGLRCRVRRGTIVRGCGGLFERTAQLVQALLIRRILLVALLEADSHGRLRARGACGCGDIVRTWAHVAGGGAARTARRLIRTAARGTKTRLTKRAKHIDGGRGAVVQEMWGQIGRIRIYGHPAAVK
jgi:hypothetical protein